MFIAFESRKLTLPCKDCHQPVTESNTVAYWLIARVFYGWCDECFSSRHSRSNFSTTEQASSQNNCAYSLASADGQ